MKGEKIKILMVEDHVEDAKHIEGLLTDFPSDLFFAGSLIKGLKCMEEDTFDLVLLDLFLPETRGIKTLQRVSDRFPNVPVIALTRLDNESVGMESVKAGAQDFLVKGDMTSTGLIKSIKYSLERFRNREKLLANEERLKMTVKKLKAANAQLKEFTYSVSHDLRAPLRAITGFSEILDKRYRSQLDEKGQHYLGNIVEAGIQMGMLIDDLLAYSRLGQGSLTSHKIDMEEFFHSTITSISDKIDGRMASIELPEEHPVVFSNRTLLKQIFTNLFVNALTFSKPDVPPQVRVRYDHDPQFWCIRVEDNGIGIHRKHLDTIFDLFQRLHSQDEFPGTGIGLSIVRKALAILNGGIEVDSREGKGTTFTVKLPRNGAR